MICFLFAKDKTSRAVLNELEFGQHVLLVKFGLLSPGRAHRCSAPPLMYVGYVVIVVVVVIVIIVTTTTTIGTIIMMSGGPLCPVIVIIISL
ncbi:hypothetical protein ACOMHN_005630 [Nucella lapillus]